MVAEENSKNSSIGSSQRQRIERQGAVELGPQDGVDARRVDIGGQTVVDRRRRVDDAAQRRLRRANMVQHRRQRRAIGDVSAIDADLGADRLQLGDPFLASGRLAPAPAEQCDGAGAVRGEPARRFEAEPFEPRR